MKVNVLQGFISLHRGELVHTRWRPNQERGRDDKDGLPILCENIQLRSDSRCTEESPSRLPWLHDTYQWSLVLRNINNDDQKCAR